METQSFKRRVFDRTESGNLRATPFFLFNMYLRHCSKCRRLFSMKSTGRDFLIYALPCHELKDLSVVCKL